MLTVLWLCYWGREEYLRKIRKNSATARLDEPPPPKRARGTMEGLDVTTKEEEEAATKEATQGENSVWMEKPKVCSLLIWTLMHYAKLHLDRWRRARMTSLTTISQACSLELHLRPLGP